MRLDCPRVAARRKRAYLGKENPFGSVKRFLNVIFKLCGTEENCEKS